MLLPHRAAISACTPQDALARPDLWQEVELLEKLLYKNSNQHRGSLHFQRLQEVRRRRRQPLCCLCHSRLPQPYPRLTLSPHRKMRRCGAWPACCARCSWTGAPPR